jgi:hypothetical protein
MSAAAPAGKTRVCPHCKAVVLESLSVCPGCRHHLRFDAEAQRRQEAATCALKIEGEFSHPGTEEPSEYSVVIVIHDDEGEEVARKVVGVGALKPGQKCGITLSVEVLPPPRAVEASAAVTLTAVPKTPAAAAGGGIRLADGTVLTPPGLGPKAR